MSEILEQQTEEREALQSIYEGDEAFKEINETTFQYKVGGPTRHKQYELTLFFFFLNIKIVRRGK